MTLPRHSSKFPKRARVRSRLDFARIYEQGVRIGDRCLSLIALPNDRPTSRLGLAVSKRCGNAVRRNSFKRRLREAFRLKKAELPSGMDFVVQPRADASLTLEDFQQSLMSLAKRAAKKLVARNPDSKSSAAANLKSTTEGGS